MIKEFEISDILSAVNSISKIEKKNTIPSIKKDSIDNSNDSSPGTKTKIKKREILVLNEMIE
jgi:hypothetical protein